VTEEHAITYKGSCFTMSVIIGEDYYKLSYERPIQRASRLRRTEPDESIAV
jgi:hypothetical protein